MSDQTPGGQTAVNGSTLAFDHVPTSANDSILSVMWRYKWLIAVFVVASLALGYWQYQRKPTTYAGSIKLMLKSDTPSRPIEDTLTNDNGGIPGGNLVQGIITADLMVNAVADDPMVKSVPAFSGQPVEVIRNAVRSGIFFQPITTTMDSRDRLIAALKYTGSDPQTCVAIVEAMSRALSERFQDERDTSINQLKDMLVNAQETLLPSLEGLQAEYKEFRQDTDLDWNTAGDVINPHRERQIAIQSARQDVESDLRKVKSELKLAQTIYERNKKDPLLVIRMIERLNGVMDTLELNMEEAAETQIPKLLEIAKSDLELERLEIDKTLIPKEIERDNLIGQFGEGHPSVKAKITEINSIREKLNDLNIKHKTRLEEIKSELLASTKTKEQLKETRKNIALEAVKTYVQGLQERILVQSDNLSELDLQIEDARKKANELRNLVENDKQYRSRINNIQGMLSKLEEKIDAVKLNESHGIVVTPMNVAEAYITGPDLKKDLILFGMLGLGFSGLLAFGFEASAKMFRSAEDVSRELRMPVLTHIPIDEGRLKQGKVADNEKLTKLDPKLSVVHRPYSASAEAIRGIRTAILFDRRAFGSKVFQITSPLPGDGKSTVSANIACSLAQSGKRVLLVDLDLRSPRLSLRFNLDDEQGLTNVLNDELAPYEAIHQTPVENLDVLGCGPLPANPAEALTLAELGDVFDWARDHYDFVIVDTPPLLMVTDPTIVTTYVDATILTMRIRRRCKPNAKEATAMLRAAGARVMGVIINKVDEMSASYKTSASGSYQSIGYGYGDKYRRRYQKESNSSDTYVVKGKSSDEGFSKPLVSGVRSDSDDSNSAGAIVGRSGIEIQDRDLDHPFVNGSGRTASLDD